MQVYWRHSTRRTTFHPDITSIAIEIQRETRGRSWVERRNETKETEKGQGEGGKKEQRRKYENKEQS